MSPTDLRAAAAVAMAAFAIGCSAPTTAVVPASSEVAGPTSDAPTSAASPGSASPSAAGSSTPTSAALSSASTTIATKQAGPTAIALDAANVYWINEGNGDVQSGSVMKASKGGGAPVVLASPFKLPLALAIDETTVYFADGAPPPSLTDVRPVGGIFAVPIAGGSTRAIATKQWAPAGVAVDATHVFWSNPGVIEGRPTTVSRAPKKGGAATALASGQLAPRAVVSDGASVFWVQSGTCDGQGKKDGLIMKASADGTGKPVALVTSISCPEGLALDATRVYFTTDTAIGAVPKAGGPSSIVVDAESMPRAVAVSGDNVYFLAFRAGAVRKVPKSGGKATTLATRKHPNGIAVDDSGVYVSDGEAGTVERFAR